MIVPRVSRTIHHRSLGVEAEISAMEQEEQELLAALEVRKIEPGQVAWEINLNLQRLRDVYVYMLHIYIYINIIYT